MKIKRLLVLAVLPMLCLAVNAQNCSKDNTPKKGDFTVAATVGYNSYTSVTAPSGLLTDYEVRALSTNWADKKLMVGFEGGWFFKDQWKLNLGGGDAQSFAYNVSAGVDRYFNIKRVPNLMWYTGIRVGFAYGENEMKYDEETSMGKSIAESWNLRGALTIGVDYFVLPALYIGAQIDPFAYTYNKTTYNPQAGLGDLSADSHNYSVLAAPTFKIGFKF